MGNARLEAEKIAIEVANEIFVFLGVQVNLDGVPEIIKKHLASAKEEGRREGYDPKVVKSFLQHNDAYDEGFREGIEKAVEVAKNWLPKDLGLNAKCAEQIRRIYDKARQ